MNVGHGYVRNESRRTHVSEKIATVMGNHSLHLSEKRGRLRNVYNGETESFYEELDRQQLMQAEALLEERKNRALSALVEVESKRKRLAEKQLELYLRENSEDYKTDVALEKCWEAATYNKMKTEERNKLRASTNHLDSCVDQLLQQLTLEQFGKEETIARKRVENALHDCAILRNQIIEKRLKIEEKILRDVKHYENLKQLAKKYEEEEQQVMLKKWKEKQQLSKEKHENMMQSVTKRKQEESFEKELSKNCCLVPLMIDGAQPSCTKEQLRLEQDLFLETQNHFKEEMRRAEIHEEELRRLENERRIEREVEADLLMEMSRRKQYQEVLQTQIMQIMSTANAGGSRADY
ncbi:hypothetical protein GE061_000950 [Apolygus lucorum]|uniref:Uncharacterized protein n=1 Tax=Apolygus lucorum TaxID=248454 RepID=A0A6A4KJR2_APOLU|nr:hypothetical protein GE061_000950 [Apolygus lucorum]